MRNKALNFETFIQTGLYNHKKQTTKKTGQHSGYLFTVVTNTLRGQL